MSATVTTPEPAVAVDNQVIRPFTVNVPQEADR